MVCNDAVHASDFFEKFVECNKYLDLCAIGVHEKYQRKGIATKLMLKSMKVNKILTALPSIYQWSVNQYILLSILLVFYQVTCEIDQSGLEEGTIFCRAIPNYSQSTWKKIDKNGPNGP